MKTKLALILLALVLSSCSRVESWELRAATKVCESHQGISYINSAPLATLVTCGDGGVTNLSGLRGMK